MNKKQEIIGMIETIVGKYNSYTVFCDWVKCCAIMVQNSLYPFFHDDVWEERERQWSETMRKYSSKEQQMFVKMFALLTEAMEEEMTDVLGQIFMEGDMGSKMNGQFFTPFHISEMVARQALRDSITPFNGKMTQLNEPSAGGGGFVIAAAKVMKENGINYHRYLVGRTIETAEVDGHGIRIFFRDGSVFLYAATDGGYSDFDLYESMEEYLEGE